MSDPPESVILLLGDPSVGKTTFLSYISPSHVGPILTLFRRLSQGSVPPSSQALMSLLDDAEQPFNFDVTLFSRPYRFLFHDTASPTRWKDVSPDVVVLCYDIGSRDSLANVQIHVQFLIIPTNPSPPRARTRRDD